MTKKNNDKMREESNSNSEENQHNIDNQSFKVLLCQVCNKKLREQVHHKDGNHKNNAEENLQHLCTLCHAKIHNIEPRFSELRYLVTLYIRSQKARCAIENQIRGFSRIELEIPEFFNQLLEQLSQQEKSYSKQIKNLLEVGDHARLETHHVDVSKTNDEGKSHLILDNQKTYAFPSYSFLKSIKGISHLLAGKILALIDIKKSPTISSLWAYAGLTPDSKKKKGKKANWNQELRMVCFQISDSFVKQRTPKYREIYDKEKAKQLSLYENFITQMKPTRHLNSQEDGENQNNIEKPVLICSSPSSKLHAERRARRKAVKEFLKDYWLECHKFK